ncbi:MAG: hypothetical protein IIA30_17060 [Myxococcales bacterium]|nr:hypothetical protein [Myxococcales bacterium]
MLRSPCASAPLALLGLWAVLSVGCADPAPAEPSAKAPAHRYSERRFAAEVRLAAPHERTVVVHASVVPQAPWHLAAEYPSSLLIRAVAVSQTPDARSPEWVWQGPASSGGVARADFELALAGSPGQPAPRPGDRLHGELRFGVCREGMQCESTVHAFELELDVER